MNPGRPRVNLTGKRFGRLVALQLDSKGPRGFLWLCRCDCGNLKLVTVHGLRFDTNSCGCLHTEALNRGRIALQKVNRRPEGHAAFEGVLRMYVESAKERGIHYDLTRESFRSLTSSSCHYCGAAPTNQWKRAGKNPNGQYFHNGIDRSDPTIGYVEGNCLPCCTTCNYAKRDKTQAEFEAWMIALVEFRTKEKK